MYHAKLQNNQVFEYPISKVVCVGRNYAEHAKELNNPIPDTPILFIKPESSVVNLHEALYIPDTDCHYETEIAVLIGKELKNSDEASVAKSIIGVGLALDLTKRDLQSKLKEKSHPWEIAKAFDGACPLSEFVSIDLIGDIQSLQFSLAINGESKQQGQASDMLNPIVPLISYMSRLFTLRPGDVVLTGTPKGVGKLNVGDKLSLDLNNVLTIETRTFANQ